MFTSRIHKPYVRKPYVHKPYVHKPYVHKPYVHIYDHKPYVHKPYAGGWRPQEGFKNGVLDQQCTLNPQPEAGAHRKASEIVSSTSNAL